MEEELKRAEERADTCQKKLQNIDDELKMVGENMKQLEVAEEKALAREERFKEEGRKSAENFKNLVMRNKVMMFSATYCSYCTVAKVRSQKSVNLG